MYFLFCLKSQHLIFDLKEISILITIRIVTLFLMYLFYNLYTVGKIKFSTIFQYRVQFKFLNSIF
jgi:hypothetical protein